MESQDQKTVILRSVFFSVLASVVVVAGAFAVLENRLYGQLGLTERPTTESDVRTFVAQGVSVPDVVASSVPAVVSVVITAEVPVIERYYEEFNPFGDLFGDGFGFNVPQRRQVGTEEREVGGGTGFFVSADGYVITNRHVVDVDDASFSIRTNDGETHAVDVVAMDPMLDIAVLKVTEDGEFSYLSFGDSGSLRLGEPVIAIGNALAEFPNSVSVGVISGLARNIVASDMFGGRESLEGLIQTDAAINRGNSGGPLLNADGEVVGMNVAVAGNSENIGFAIPAATVENVYQSVVEHGEIIRPFLGVRYLQITEEVAERNDLSVDHGIRIVRGQTPADPAVIPGSPADRAGLEENDIILEMEGTRLDGSRSFASIIRTYEVGDTVTLRVLHDGEERTVEATLERAPTD